MSRLGRNSRFSPRALPDEVEEAHGLADVTPTWHDEEDETGEHDEDRQHPQRHDGGERERHHGKGDTAQGRLGQRHGPRATRQADLGHRAGLRERCLTRSYLVVACTEAHAWFSRGVVAVPDGRYSVERIDAAARGRCPQVLHRGDRRYLWIRPTEYAWTGGERHVTCYARTWRRVRDAARARIDDPGPCRWWR